MDSRKDLHKGVPRNPLAKRGPCERKCSVWSVGRTGPVATEIWATEYAYVSPQQLGKAERCGLHPEDITSITEHDKLLEHRCGMWLNPQ